MIEIPLILYALLAFMIIASVIAMETRDLLSSVICVGTAGFGLAVIDLFLAAPDLAITQVVVEVVILVVLIRVVLTRRDETHETPKDTLSVAVVGVLVTVLLAASLVAFRHLHPFGQPLMADPATAGVGRAYLEGTLKETGSANAVMAILLDYRGYDTLGEATVIFTAVVAVGAVLRRIGRTSSAKEGPSGEGGE